MSLYSLVVLDNFYISYCIIKVMIHELRQKLGSLIKALEVFLVLKDAKPVSRVILNEDVSDYLSDLGLFVKKADFKIKKLDNGDYSNKGEIVSLNKEGKCVFYVAKDSELAKKAKRLEAENDHLNLGLALGYPKCCCDFFENNKEDFASKNNDLLPASLAGSKGYIFPFYNNIAARYFDYTLLHHFPCNLNCKESLELAKKYLDVIEKEDFKIASQIKENLLHTVIHTSIGTFILKNSRLKENYIYYDSIRTNNVNKLGEMLNNSKEIKVIDKNKILINNQELNNINVMLFF